MSLVKQQLKTAIQTLLTDMRSREDVSDDDFSDQLATAIDSYIKSATITVAPGIPVATAGSAAAQTGTTTAPAIGTIS